MNRAVREFFVSNSCDLYDFLRDKFPDKSKNNIKSMIDDECIYVNNLLVSEKKYELNKNDKVFVILRQIYAQYHKIDIIYEDDYFIGINKPSGLLSVSTKSSDYTAYSIVRNYMNKKNKKLFILHRLDKDTSGILLFCKDEKIKEYMQNNWNELVLKRGYLGIVNGNYDVGTIKSYLYEDKNYNVRSTNNSKMGKLAITHYKAIKKTNKYTLLQIFIDTGRKNQIRVHMNDIGTYIIGDKKYGKGKYKRLYLHANIFSFIHPITKKETTIECFPNDFLVK